MVVLTTRPTHGGWRLEGHDERGIGGSWYLRALDQVPDMVRQLDAVLGGVRYGFDEVEQ